MEVNKSHNKQTVVEKLLFIHSSICSYNRNLSEQFDVVSVWGCKDLSHMHESDFPGFLHGDYPEPCRHIKMACAEQTVTKKKQTEKTPSDTII